MRLRSLARSGGLAIKVPEGWELSKTGAQYLSKLGVSRLSPGATAVAVDLRAYLDDITDTQVKTFVEEAIRSYEHELYRSAIVMSWLGAIAVLQAHVVAHCLHLFNTEAKRVDTRWRTANTTDDLGHMKEGEFLDRLAAISVIGKNVKEELQKALKLRNGCGHPNSLRLSGNIAAAHLELLLLNVFKVFS